MVIFGSLRNEIVILFLKVVENLKLGSEMAISLLKIGKNGILRNEYGIIRVDGNNNDK